MSAPTPASHRILIADDQADVIEALRLLLKAEGYLIDTAKSPSSVLKAVEQRDYALALIDLNYSRDTTSGQEGIECLRTVEKLSPDSKVIFMTAYGGVETAVKAIKEGASDFVVKPWDNDKLVATVGATLRFSQAAQAVKELEARQRELSRYIGAPGAEIVGGSPAILRLLGDIQKVARTDASVLILGENGTGKELVARAIHRASQRSDNPFVHVDLGAVPGSLFESELFGHKKGAFTDAKEDRAGRFEIAAGGTLFLDEIGNLTLQMQAKLLGALETRRITRVGSDRAVPVDVRVICATNLADSELRDPARFRQDLLYRINTIELRIPPLRERGGDIPLLAEHFAAFYSRKYGKPRLRIDASTMERLRAWPWPGNVRELRHVIERAVILSEHPAMQLEGMLPESAPAVAALTEKTLPLNLDELEKIAIRRALAEHDGNLSRAALTLGLGRSTLYRKMARHGLHQ